MHRLTEHTTQVVDAVGAGIMLADDSGKLDFVAATEELVVEVERHQSRVGQGACHEAFATNAIVAIDDLTVEERWPEYTQLAIESGLLSVLGVPMNAHGQTIGVFNIYRDRPTHWTDDDVKAAEILTAMGAGYVLNANQLRAQQGLAEQLEQAVDSRDLIGQAKGILMARAEVDADRAFEILRERSQGSNRKLREVAQDVVEQQRSQTGTRRR